MTCAPRRVDCAIEAAPIKSNTAERKGDSMRHELSGLLVCVLLGATSSVSAHSFNEVVPTDKGVVIGSRTDAGRQFLGIPYAAAPVGALRWKEPQPVARWHTPRVTQQFESSCPQTPSAFGLASLDEDCL